VDGGKAFIELRDRLLREGVSHAQAPQAFQWPAVGEFNWATDYFDRIAAGNDRPALRVVDDVGHDHVLSYATLARRSNQVANFLAAQGVATVLAYQFERFSAAALLDQLVRCRVTTFCAPPTVWRMLIQEDLRRWPVMLREVVGAGEPLNPEVIEQVRAAWGLTIRDGFGQTETTAQIGNPPGQRLMSGKIRRVDLRRIENDRAQGAARRSCEYWEEDFIEPRRS